MQIEQFHYRVPWRARGALPGFHVGSRAGGGLEFRGYASLLEAPDPRRFDLRASLRDPFEQLVVRVYTQRSAVAVFAVADLSASMGFRGRARRLDLLADFVQSAGYSAYRSGDPFAFIGCDSTVRPDYIQRPTHSKAAGQALAERLRVFAPTGRDSRGLLDAASLLTRARAIVFLLSDFHFPLDLLRRVLACLSYHALVPVVLWDGAELEPPTRGLVRLRDPESGAQRTVLLRPAMRTRMSAAFAQRRAALTRCFTQHGLRALFMVDSFRAEAVTQYFYQ